MYREDMAVLVLIVVIAAVWGFVAFKRWLNAPSRRVKFSLGEKVTERNETVELLETNGYEVVSEKKRIPVTIIVDGEQLLESRLYIDYFARREDKNELYAVKVARERKPLDMTGSGIRDALLPYYLLYDELAGVLYVDTKRGTVTQIHFEIEEDA